MKTMIMAAVAVVLLVGIGGLVLKSRSEIAQPIEALEAPRFVDETMLAGVEHSYSGGAQYFEGGGLAAFDC